MGDRDKLYLSLGILVVLFLFTLLETINPYFFLGDDNAKQFFPMITEGMDQIFSGHLPSINLHQLMGTKILETGTYAVLYPPMILSYIFSHHIFGNDFLLFEVFVLIHLILGFLFTFLFLKSKTENSLISMFASFAFIFSGYILGLSQGWYYVAPLAVFLPLILFLNDSLHKKELKNIFLLGGARGILFYSGGSQYFIYLILFEFFYFLLRNYQSNWNTFSTEIKNYALSMFVSLIITIPLTWAQLVTSNESQRGNLSILEYLISRPAFPTDIFPGSLIFPSLLGYSSFLFRYSSVYYSGTLFSLFFFLGGIYYLVKYKSNSLKKISPLFWCGVLAIILSLGIIGLLYSFGALIPIIKNFRDPYKFIPFSNFFMVSFGAIILSKLVKQKLIKKFSLMILLIFFSILIFGNILHQSNNQSREYFIDIPLDTTPFDELNLGEHRLISLATNSQFDPEFANKVGTNNLPNPYFLNYNFATLFNLDHLGGYEIFRDDLTSEKLPIGAEGISNSNLNLSTLQKYNVKYILAFKNASKFHTNLNELKKIRTLEGELILYELENTEGYVFSNKGELSYTKLHNGFNFETKFNSSENVTVNLLYKKNYVAKVNGKNIPVYYDDFGRIYLNIPDGNNSVEIFYKSKDFFKGILISLILTLFTIPLIFWKKLRKFKLILKIPFNINMKLVWTLIIFFLIATLLFNFFSTTEIEKLISKKTGFDSKIDKIKINPFKGIAELSKVSFKNSESEELLYSNKITFFVDPKKTIDYFIKNKRPVIYLDKIVLENVSLNINLNDEKINPFCKYPLKISYPTDIEEDYSLKLSKEKWTLNEILFIPIKTVIISFQDDRFISELNISISGDIRFERYLNGNLSITNDDSSDHLVKEKCIILPTYKKNNLYY